MKNNLNDYIPSKYNQLVYYILNNKYPKYSLWGGRAGGKSSIIALIGLIILLRNAGSGGGNIAVFRKYKAGMRKSLYAEFRKVANRLKIADKFIFYKSPLKIVCKVTGHEALFSGLYDVQGEKGTTFENGIPCRLLLYEEFQEFENREDVDDNSLTFTRGGSDNDDDFEEEKENSCPIIYSWNPLDRISAFQYKEFRETTDDMYCIHATYLDLPKKWLGKAFLKEAERIKSVDIDLYNFRFLGIPRSNQGLVFKNVKEFTADKGKFKTLQRGLDFGTATQGDPSAYVVCHYDDTTKTLYIVDEWYKKDTNYREIAKAILVENTHNFTVYCDNADSGGIKQLGLEGLKRAIPCKKGKVDTGVKWLRGLNAIYIDPQRCPNTYREFTEYSYKLQKSTGDYILDDKNNHTIDAIRYALSDFIKY